MKKILLLLYFAMIAMTSFASKADQTPITVTQPDGTRLTVILHGDEYAHWYTTTDGVLIVQKQKGFYIAQVTADGGLEGTNQLAHAAANRTQQEKALIRQQDKNFFLAVQSKKLGGRNLSEGGFKKIPIRDDSSLFPHTGSPKAIVILVEFSDTTFSLPNPKASFEQYLNGEGRPVNLGNREDLNYKSIKEYFKDMSDGAFVPQFDLYGPYNLNQELKYYGAGMDNMSRLIPDACNAAAADVDFSQYDSNGDGRVDLVYIIYAGYSQSVTGNSEECIWPKSGAQNFGMWNGKQVYRYGVNNELNAFPGAYSSAPYKRINGVGLFVHEFSHTLGLPDLYATQGSTGENQDNQGMEFWSVMDGGTYVNNGYYPTAYTAWERETMGWFMPEILTDTLRVDALAPIDFGGAAYKIMNDNDATGREYVMLQNIQLAGWNAKQKGHGLLAYRVNYQRDNVYLTDNPNNTLGSPQIVVLPADGLLLAQANAGSSSEYYSQMAGDPYPGTSGVDSVNFVMSDGSILQKPVFNIVETTEGFISFDYLGVKKPLPDTIHQLEDETRQPVDNRIYSIDGNYVGTDAGVLHKGVYIKNRKKIIIK